MERKIKEIEVVTTVEITHTYSGDELTAVMDDLPSTPEELAELKERFADAVRNDTLVSCQADHVHIVNVQYFEKEEDNEKADSAEVTE